jgi:hypothetical protein
MTKWHIESAVHYTPRTTLAWLPSLGEAWCTGGDANDENPDVAQVSNGIVSFSPTRRAFEQRVQNTRASQTAPDCYLARVGHAAAFVEDGLLLIGGEHSNGHGVTYGDLETLQDVVLYEFASKQWRTLAEPVPSFETEDEAPEWLPRTKGAALVALGPKRALFFPAFNEAPFVDDLTREDVLAKENAGDAGHSIGVLLRDANYKLEMKSAPPGFRAATGASMAVTHDQKVLSFGGFREFLVSEKWEMPSLGELFIFDPDAWQVEHTGLVAPPRYGASCVYIDTGHFIVGDTDEEATWAIFHVPSHSVRVFPKPAELPVGSQLLFADGTLWSLFGKDGTWRAHALSLKELGIE